MKFLVIVISFVSTCLLTVGWPGRAQGAPPTAAASPPIVSLSGCPLAGAETGCLVMLHKGQTYDISAAPSQIDPKQPNLPPAPPRVNYWEIKASGTVSSNNGGKCTEGVHLENITWRYLRVKCLKPIRP